MDEKLAFTIREMYRLSHEYASDVAKYNLKSIYNVFDFVRSIPYTRDIDSCGREECLKRPYFGVFEGDCDDKAIVSGAALDLISVPWRFVTTSTRSDRAMQHVYLEIFNDGNWRAFDATYPQNQIWCERPYTKKIIWDNPMRYDNPSMNVSTLEGLGDTPLIVIGDVDAIIKKLQDIPFVGSLFKTKTKTESYDQALTQQRDIFSRVVKIYNDLPSENAKAQMLQMCTSFFQNWIMPDLGHRWNNAISNAFSQKWTLSPDWSYPQNRCALYLSIPFFYFLYLDDIDTLQEDLKNWFVDPVIRIVWTPLNDYLKANYGTSLPEYPIRSDSPGSNAGIGILVLGGLALALISMKAKR